MLDWDEELYNKACRALYQRCRRRGWIYDQPNRHISEVNSKGTLILRNINGELGRYDTQKQRLIALRPA